MLKSSLIFLASKPVVWQGRRSFLKDLHGRLGVLGVPFGKGQKKEEDYLVGLQKAPDVIRATNFIQNLQCVGVDVKDYGNVSYDVGDESIKMDNMNNLCHVAPLNLQVSRSVQKVLSDNRMCLTLGGDHSIAIGTIDGHMNVAEPDDVAVLYVDAHADINLQTSSPSGNIHGMTLALLAKELAEFWPPVPGLDWLKPRLSLKNLAYIAIRSIDPGEAYLIQKHEIAAYYMNDIQRYGIHDVVHKALERIDPAGNKSIHLSFDTDSLDYFEAPSTTVPVRGGLSLREVLSIMEIIHNTRRLSAMDVVEVNPCLGSPDQKRITLEAILHILLSAFGCHRKGNPMKPC